MENATTSTPSTPQTMESTPSVSPVTPPSQSQAKKNHLVPIIIGVVGLLLFLGIGGAALAYFFIVNSPENVIKKGIANTSEIKSAAFDTTIAITAKDSATNQYTATLGNTSEPLDLTVNLNGAFDVNDLDNLKYGAKLTATMKRTGGSEEIAFDTRVIKDIVYINVKSLGMSPFAAFSQFQNQWIKLDPKAMEQQYGVDSERETQKEEKELTPEQEEKLRALYKDAKIITNIKQLPSEKLHDQNMHHYAFTIDEAELKRVLKETYKILEEKGTKGMTEKDLNEMFDAITFTSNEIWIGKQDKQVHSLKSTIQIKGDDGEGTVVFTGRMKDHNKPANITVPEGAKDFQVILQEMMNGYGAPTTPSGRMPAVQGAKTSATKEQQMKAEQEAQNNVELINAMGAFF